MKTTIESLEKEILRIREIQTERDLRIANFETDEDDCFMSIKAENTAILVAKKKIEILKNKGLAMFERLATLDGKIIENSRIIETKYGECWLANGIFVNIPSFSCKAGRQVWVEAGFKNHKEAEEKLYYSNEQTDKDLYYDLAFKSREKGFEEKGYMIVDVERPAWVTIKSDSIGLNAYPVVFESDFNYFEE